MQAGISVSQYFAQFNALFAVTASNLALQGTFARD
jgi:hypothetical protein